MMGIIFAGMVVTTSDGLGKAKLAQPGNREWATVIQGVNARGWAIPPFIILAAQYHLANWYTECNLPADWRIATTNNGWTTNKVGLDWIKHFDHSYSTSYERHIPVIDPRWPREPPLDRIRALLPEPQHYYTLYASTFLPPPPATRCWLLWAIKAGVRSPDRGLNACTYQPREQARVPLWIP